MPIVLVQNELTANGKYDHWRDQEGVTYHFPNTYINKIREGEMFIYYRGVRRKNNKRGIPEYFGFGRIGKVTLDPETDFSQVRKKTRWFCEIADYIPFKAPIPAKVNGLFFEKLSKNLWGNLRSISIERFQLILEAASIPMINNEPIIAPNSPIIPHIDDIKPIMCDGERLLLSSAGAQIAAAKSSAGEGKWARHSKYAKLYGDHSEKVVYNALASAGSKNLRWVAKEKEKPGWDIEYYDNENLIAVEVKATSGKSFLNVEITAGEWNAAKEKGANYSLYLVAECLSTRPRIQVINNPYYLYLQNELSLDPLLYRIRMIE